ncbi:uncharacterized protein LOC121110641 isoform X1 [Gallus gallus]|uniref:uncharacterized protein LOC121110641 isoform X1 n=1 Tax=Gallus gallus TaxID=9031 RepID=UPI001AE57450|nr:uncharacterized protein LOC121110641 isoform X1 [Gallus gallus]
MRRTGKSKSHQHKPCWTKRQAVLCTCPGKKCFCETALEQHSSSCWAALRGFCSSLHVKLSITLLPHAQNVADANTNGTQNSAHSTPMCADETRTDQERSQPAGNNSLTFFCVKCNGDR